MSIAELCRRGFADRMVLSHDTACHFNGMLPAVMAERMPEWRFLLIPNDVLPALERLGVTGEQIAAMMADNPRRLFEAQEPYRGCAGDPLIAVTGPAVTHGHGGYPILEVGLALSRSAPEVRSGPDHPRNRDGLLHGRAPRRPDDGGQGDTPAADLQRG